MGGANLGPVGQGGGGPAGCGWAFEADLIPAHRPTRTAPPPSLTGADLNDPACSLAGTDRAPRIPEDNGLLTRIPGLGYYVNHG